MQDIQCLVTNKAFSTGKTTPTPFPIPQKTLVLSIHLAREVFLTTEKWEKIKLN